MRRPPCCSSDAIPRPIWPLLISVQLVELLWVGLTFAGVEHLAIAEGPVFGLNLQSLPLADLLVELAYGWVCWRLFGGRRGLLGAIVVFNLLDIPLMFPQAGTGAMLSAHPAILPPLILVQIIASWVAVWWLSLPRERSRASL